MNIRHPFDSDFSSSEQLPLNFSVSFIEENYKGRLVVRVLYNGTTQVGDVLNDNSYDEDFYRFHDVFHYSFAALLGWSPCTRSLLSRKRKSKALVDEVEDGARATITEEAISLMVFNHAKKKRFYSGVHKVPKGLLRTIKNLTQGFEVRMRTTEEWEYAILKAYEAFRTLIFHRGGTVSYDFYANTIRVDVPNHDC